LIGDLFPPRQRARAMGIFMLGLPAGLALAYFSAGAIGAAFGWRAAFIATGALTMVWLLAWLAWYRPPREQPRLSAAELAYIEQDPREPRRPVALRRLLIARETWAYILGRFLIDPVWWTFLFWLPDFLSKRFGVDLQGYGPPLVTIYILADVGSITGGWISSRLLARGVRLNFARKITMLGCAIVVVPVALAADAPHLWIAVGLIGLACAGHQGFSANLYALPSDLFPRWAVGSVVGLGGFAGAAGGMLMAQYAGWVLQTLGGYRPIFIVASGAYLLAVLVVHILTPDYRRCALNAAT